MAQAELIERYDSAAPDWGSRISQLGYSAAYREFIRQVDVDRRTGLRVCDIGTGSGTFSKAFLAERSGISHLALVDPSDEMLTQAKSALHPLCDELRVYRQTLEHHQPDTRYDVILVVHVIEHCCDPTDALRLLWNLVTPGGTLLMIISRPHWCQWLIWLRWHHRWFSAQTIRAMADDLNMGETEVFRFARGAPRRTSFGYAFFKPNRNEKEQSC
jgi:2-polyprenyl-3-methyl-5-hydroxy-6-metoxy-1,4-benzoquinol methylase